MYVLPCTDLGQFIVCFPSYFIVAYIEGKLRSSGFAYAENFLRQ